MKSVTVLGSTGSIGVQTLDVLGAFKKEFNVRALCAGSNAALLIAQAKEFLPEYVGIAEESCACQVRLALPGVRVISGDNAASELAALDADRVVHGINGFAGLRPLIAALNAGRTVALANKESVVCAIDPVRQAIKTGGGCILPVDSEQSAIFQCLSCGEHAEVKRLILTASGGPFFGYDEARLNSVTVEDALRHPTWNMGKKITLDSATLFNKGLEIIEASHLFDIPCESIDVLVHRQSIVHSMVEFVDGSSIAQLSRPDMRLAIQYALTYPARMAGNFGGLALTGSALTFDAPDTALFHAIPLAYEALKAGGAMPAAYNAANEVAARLFFEHKIGFLDIQRIVEYTMQGCETGGISTLDDVLKADAAARRRAEGWPYKERYQ